jgi:hypothetical protein
MLVGVLLKKRIYSFKIDPAMADALKAIKARDGVLESEQIRRGIALWLKIKGGYAEIGALTGEHPQALLDKSAEMSCRRGCLPTCR